MLNTFQVEGGGWGVSHKTKIEAEGSSFKPVDDQTIPHGQNGSWRPNTALLCSATAGNLRSRDLQWCSQFHIL